MDEARQTGSTMRESVGNTSPAFQGRVRLYLAVLLALLAFLHLVLVVVRSALGTSPVRDVLLDPDALRRVASILACGALVALASARRMSRGSLLALDLSAALLVSGSVLLGIALRPMEMRPELSALLTVMLVLFVRAALLPSSARRTLAVGAMTLAPLLLVAPLFFPADRLMSGVPYRRLMRLMIFGFGTATLAVTALVSDVIYKLRRSAQRGDVLGPYQLSRKLGEGGMGVVYEAHHALLRRRTALKLIRSARHDAASEELFEREARLTSQLCHPNTVALFDYGQTSDGIDYYAMEYVDGLTLLELVRDGGPLPSGRVLTLLRQVAASLAQAHRQGLIHRDVKPSNVMICHQDGHPDLVKVLDFGLARSLATELDASSPDLRAGTPEYMAPEAVFSPLSVGPASDVYAVGVLGYFLLTGAVPFGGVSVGRIAHAHQQDTPLPPSLLTGNEVPADLEKILLACLAKDPTARHADGQSLLQALRDCRDGADWSTGAAEQWWQGWLRRRAARDASAHLASRPEPDGPTLRDPTAPHTRREAPNVTMADVQPALLATLPGQAFQLCLPAKPR